MPKRALAVLVAATLMMAVACDRGSGGPTPASPSPSPSPTEAAPQGRAASPSPTVGAAAPQAPAPAPPPAASAPLAPSAVQPTDPGRYVFDQTGTRDTGGCGRDGPPPTPTTLTVSPANGSRQRSVWNRTEGDDGMVVTTDLEYRADGIYLIYLHQEQKTPLGAVVNEFQPVPPPIVMPARPSAGQKWSFSLRSKDGQITVDVANTVEDTAAAVRLGSGRTVSTVRVHRRSHIRGQSILGTVDLVEEARSWVSLAARLAVKEVSDTEGTVGTCKVESHIEALLR